MDGGLTSHPQEGTLHYGTPAERPQSGTHPTVRNFEQSATSRRYKVDFSSALAVSYRCLLPLGVLNRSKQLCTRSGQDMMICRCQTSGPERRFDDLQLEKMKTKVLVGYSGR